MFSSSSDWGVGAGGGCARGGGRWARERLQHPICGRRAGRAPTGDNTRFIAFTGLGFISIFSKTQASPRRVHAEQGATPPHFTRLLLHMEHASGLCGGMQGSTQHEMKAWAGTEEAGRRRGAARTRRGSMRVFFEVCQCPCSGTAQEGRGKRRPIAH